MTKILFIVDDKKRIIVTGPEHMGGTLLPVGFVSGFKHEFNKDGSSGWVEVPDSYISDAEVKIVGLTEGSEYEVMRVEQREKGLKEIATSSSFTPPTKEWIDQLGGFQLSEVTEDDLPMFPEDQHQLSYLNSPDELFESDLPFYGAESILKVLGFSPRYNNDGSVHMWYHPVLGDDRRDNYLLFDTETDTEASISVKIFRLGARLGTRGLKLAIKSALDNH